METNPLGAYHALTSAIISSVAKSSAACKLQSLNQTLKSGLICWSPQCAFTVLEAFKQNPFSHDFIELRKMNTLAKMIF